MENIIGAEKKFAVLLCAEDSEYVKKMYGGYFGVFVGLLGAEGEKWENFRVSNGEFPDEDQIESFDGFVVTGSYCDAHGDDDWICKLMALLKKLDSLKKKVVGICFGHQILARSLGGKTGRSNLGWDIGVTPIHFSSTNLITSLEIPARLSIIECNRDEVKELPPMTEVMTTSAKTGIEMFKYGEHMMGIQGHPEYTRDILLHLIDRLHECGYITESFADEIKVNFEGQEPNGEALKNLCISFLKGKL